MRQRNTGRAYVELPKDCGLEISTQGCWQFIACMVDQNMPIFLNSKTKEESRSFHLSVSQSPRPLSVSLVGRLHATQSVQECAELNPWSLLANTIVLWFLLRLIASILPLQPKTKISNCLQLSHSSMEIEEGRIQFDLLFYWNGQSLCVLWPGSACKLTPWGGCVRCKQTLIMVWSDTGATASSILIYRSVNTSDIISS